MERVISVYMVKVVKMETIPVMGIAILVFFIVINIIRYFENSSQRKYEFRMEKLRLSNRFVVAPFICYLLNDLHNITDIDSKTMNRLVMILESLQGNYINENQNLIQLNDDKNSLKEILENGNLATDVALKIKQLLDIMQ